MTVARPVRSRQRRVARGEEAGQTNSVGADDDAPTLPHCESITSKITATLIRATPIAVIQEGMTQERPSRRIARC